MTIQPAAQHTAAAIAQQVAPGPRTTEPTAAKTVTGATKAYSVTLSKQAMQLNNSPGYTAGEEASESPAAKAAEKQKGQR
ncbi:MAG: hypothetical protein M0T70_16575 [Geobacteraceae bacterium]|nr:hypothetical protein [Geobacteraceae bacterium]